MDVSSSNHTLSTGQPIDVSTSPGTRYYTLLNTNEPAEGSDLTFIHSLISNTDARLAFLDHEIPNLQEKLSKLQKTLKQLEDERASLSSYQTRIRATLSPLRRMPPEVLAEIFMWTLPSIGDALTGGRFHVARSPWLLTQISSRWRAVSLATPSLWSRVVMDYSEGATRLPYYSLALVETQIQRAHKLKIHFYGCSTLPDSRPQIQIFEFLLQHSSRWEELSLGLTCAIVPLLTALRDRVPALKRLWIQWEDDPDRRPSVQTIDCFQSAPSLVDFGFSQSIPVPVSIHQLTRYQVEGSWETQKGILKLASNLVEARIDLVDEEPFPVSDEIVDIPHIRRLFVTHAEALDDLRTPALEELGFRADEDQPPDIRLVESFLDRSACSLRRLSLSGSPDADTTIRMLQKFAFITELVIIIYESGAQSEIDLLMSNLTISPIAGNNVTAPQLRCLVFGCEDDARINYEMYLEMLKSRWRTVNCQLKNAALLMQAAGLDSATFRGLEALRREGLDIVVLEGYAARQEAKYWDLETPWN